jgi:hypothetical protein
MAFLENQGRLHLIGSLTFEGVIPADSEALAHEGDRENYCRELN